jgi:hypothetical protein
MENAMDPWIPLNFPWNSMEKYNEKTRQMFMKNFMEFHGKFHGLTERFSPGF